jgi:DNA-binding response OmpR family regulator
VNDDPVQLELITHVIEQSSAQVFPFHRAADALAHIVQSTDVDLVVTDLHMPGIDGWRFCHLLRSSDFPWTNQTPVLIVSATLSRDDVGTIPLDVGADAFLSMPYTPEELQEAVKRLLHHESPVAHPTVLIAACTAKERRQIVDGFAAHGYQPLETENGGEALAVFHEHHPDVVVLDHCPPQIAGLELIPILKSDRHAVVLVITDQCPPELAIALTRQGADVHITRPYDVDELIEQVPQAQKGRALLHVENTLEMWT